MHRKEKLFNLFKSITRFIQFSRIKVMYYTFVRVLTIFMFFSPFLLNI